MIQLLFVLMGYEGLLVASRCLLCFVGRFKEFRIAHYGVGGPLLCRSEDECASKEFLVFYIVGGAAVVLSRGGRATQKQNKHLNFSRDFDTTMGFPGEDITSLTSNLV